MMNKVHIWGDSLTSVIMSSIGVDDTDDIGCLSNIYNYNNIVGVISTITTKDLIYEDKYLSGLSGIGKSNIRVSRIG